MNMKAEIRKLADRYVAELKLKVEERVPPCRSAIYLISD